jgi:hypothetical protein
MIKVKSYLLFVFLSILFFSIILPIYGDTGDGIVFGPQQYTRGTGKPVPNTTVFTSANTGSGFIMKIHNGDINGNYRVSSGTITLNGELVVTNDDFSQQVEWIEKEVSLESVNELSVTLTSLPGSFLTITIYESGLRPTVAITASPETIEPGQSSTLTWNSTNADSASIDHGIGDVEPNGTRVVTPSETVTFTITVTGPGGNATASVTVTVIDLPLPTVNISAYPTTIQAGESSTLTWNSTNANSASIDNGIGIVDTSGSTTVTPGKSTTYTITVIGVGGSETASVVVTVTDNPNPPPTVSISANPSTVLKGGSVTLSWNSANAVSASIDNGIGSVELNGTLTVTPPETSTYTITVVGPGGTAAAETTVTVTYPNAIVSISASPEMVMYGQSTTLTWESENAVSASIDQGIGSVPVNGSILVTPGSDTTYTITAKGIDSTASASVTVKISPITVDIISPVDGSSISRPDVMVEGTVINTMGNETGVTVNQIPANIEGNSFMVNHVLLAEGKNVLNVIATDSEGNSAATSIEVTMQPSSAYISVTADVESGVSPLEAFIRIDGTFRFTTPPLGYSGPGPVEFLDATEDGYRVKMTAQGVYRFSAQVSDDQGNVHSDSVTVKVMNVNDLDTMLKAKWTAMKIALANKEIDKAASYFTEETRQTYLGLFTALKENLPDIALDMQEIEPVYFPAYGAKYRIKRDDTIKGASHAIAFYIYFSIDRDGIWRIFRF